MANPSLLAPPARVAARLAARPDALGVARLEILAVAALALLALAVRWPELASVPRFGDETREVLLGLRILRGEALPLVNWDPDLRTTTPGVGGAYIGALFNYLVAATFALVGPRLEAGRMLVALLGACAVVPTYLLGRTLAGPLVGVLAALFLTTSATHIAVSSHIAYSHSLTPLFSTLGLWLLARAVALRSGPSLVAAGLAFGLAVHTHPLALALLPGACAYLLWKGRPLLGRWVLLAAAAAAVTLAGPIAFNLASGFQGVSRAVAQSDASTGGLSLLDWPMRLLNLVGELPAGLAGLLSETNAQPASILHPLAALYVGLALVGLALLARRGAWLPCCALVSGILLTSLLNGKNAPVLGHARYYAPLLPVLYVCAAVGLLGLAERAAQAWSPRPSAVATGAAVLALTTAPLLGLRAYYADAYATARTNQPLFRTLEALDANGPRDETVYLDEALADVQFSGGRYLFQLDLAFALSGQRFEAVNLKEQARLDPARRLSGRIVLDDSSLDSARALFQLRSLQDESDRRAPLRAFRATPRPR